MSSLKTLEKDLPGGFMYLKDCCMAEGRNLFLVLRQCGFKHGLCRRADFRLVRVFVTEMLKSIQTRQRWDSLSLDSTNRGWVASALRTMRG